MEHVRQILEQKGSAVWTISPESTVFEALQFMAEKEVGALLVTEEEAVVGVLSERDYARKVILKGKSSKEQHVRDIMTIDITYVEPDQTTDDCMALMSNKHIRHLPVLENGKLIGIVSIGDVVKAIIAKKEYIIEQLEHYIHGKR